MGSANVKMSDIVLQAFSTSSKYLVSVGSQHDMIVNVWEWRSNLKLASNKVQTNVSYIICRYIVCLDVSVKCESGL